LVIALNISCNDYKLGQSPNIVLIYADDLGRGLLGIYGQQIISTPNIDRLADEGMRFDNAYGCMVCAPARASLITGRHDCHADSWSITKGGIYKELGKSLDYKSIKEKINKVAKPAKDGEVFLGQVAQQVGYTTAEFGKLEWGFATTPERIKRHGWDYHFGYYDHIRCHGYYPPFLWENGKKVDIPGNTRADCGKSAIRETPKAYKDRWNMEGKEVYSEHIIMEKLLEFIDDNNPNNTHKPFFIYFPTQLPHGPVMIPEVHADFKENMNLTEIEKEYASMVKMLDNDVGRIISKLEELNLLENTIVVFTSDNGHEIYYSQAGRCSSSWKKNLLGEPYDNVNTKFYSELNGDIFDGNDGMAGLKRTNWEGGTRVPLFWYWKDKIEAGTVSSQMVSNYDFLNTLAEIIGQEQLEEKDGISYAETLFGGQSIVRNHTTYASVMGPALVTHDGWKLRYFRKDRLFQLYYLPDDYKEENDLSELNEDKLEELKTILYDACDQNLRNGSGSRLVDALN
jgi:arylsulfatase A-like enzyme